MNTVGIRKTKSSVVEQYSIAGCSSYKVIGSLTAIMIVTLLTI